MIEWAECFLGIVVGYHGNIPTESLHFTTIFWTRFLVFSHQLDYYLLTHANFNIGIRLNLSLNHFILMIPMREKNTYTQTNECVCESPRPANLHIDDWAKLIYTWSLNPVRRGIFPPPSWLHYSFIMRKGHREKKQKTKGG
jgi:hypothetical protein